MPGFCERETLLNSDMGATEIREHCRLDEVGERLLNAVVQRLQHSAHAYQRILDLDRTVADLDVPDPIQIDHLAEVVSCSANLGSPMLGNRGEPETPGA